MDRDDKPYLKKFKITKGKAILICVVLAAAVGAAAAGIVKSPDFNPNAFKTDKEAQLNEAKFEDGALGSDNKEDSKDSDIVEDEGNNKEENPSADAIEDQQLPKSLFNLQKNIPNNNADQNVVAKVLSSEESENVPAAAVSLGSGRAGDAVRANNAVDKENGKSSYSNSNTAENEANNSDTDSQPQQQTSGAKSNTGSYGSSSSDDEFFDTGKSSSQPQSSDDENSSKPDEPGVSEPSETPEEKPGISINEPDPTPELPQDDIVFGSNHFPQGGFEYDDTSVSAASDSLEIITIPIYWESLYYGQTLDDWTLLCSMMLYYKQNDEYYRIMELDPDIISFGDYPDTVEDNFDLTINFRPSKNSEWQEYTASFEVAPYKVAIKDLSGNIIAFESLDEGESINLLNYYDNVQTQSPLTELFLGWSTLPEGMGNIYTTEFIPAEKGKTTLYALPTVELGSDFIADMEYYWGLGFVNLQTLIDYIGLDKYVNTPNGIQQISLDRNVESLYVPSTVINVSLDNFNYNCENAYFVSEDNLYYSSENGILMNKDKTVIYDIPLSVTQLEISDNVTQVNIKYNNNINKIIIDSQIPPELDLSYINNAEIVVPDGAYYNYLIKWSEILGTNTLITQNNEQNNYANEANCIYSADKTTLYSVKNSRSGYVMLSDNIKVISDNAFGNNTSAQIVFIPSSAEILGSNVFSDGAANKIVFMGIQPPEINSDTFNVSDGRDIKIYVPEGCRNTYINKWAPVLGTDVCEAVISENTAKLYSDSRNSLIFTAGNENILVKADLSIIDFDNSYLAETGIDLTEIAGFAFADNTNLRTIDIPEGIKSIGNNAFDGCMALELAVIGSTDYITIGDMAFNNCYSIRAIASNAQYAEFKNYYTPYISNSYTVPNGEGYGYEWNLWDGRYYIKRDGDNIYLYGEDQPSEGNGFQLCRFLRGALSTTSGTVVFEENTKEIGAYVFADCMNLDNIDIPSSVYSIGDFAFNGCGIKKADIGFGITYLGIGAYSYCTSLESVYIDGNISSLPSYTFNGCAALSNISFGENTTIYELQNMAFDSCPCEEIVLPPSVGSVYVNTFSQMSDLHRLVFTSENPPSLITWSIGVEFTFGDMLPEDFTILVPEGSEQTYIDMWKYCILGYVPGEVSDDEAADGEAIVRRLLDLPLESAADNVVDDNEAFEAAIEEETEITSEALGFDGDENAEAILENTEAAAEQEAVSEEFTEAEPLYIIENSEALSEEYETDISYDDNDFELGSDDSLDLELYGQDEDEKG